MSVAQNTSFRTKQILIGRMADLTQNVSPMTATKYWDISEYAANFNLDITKQKQATTVVANAGQQSADIVGGVMVEGSIELNLPIEMLGLLVSGVYGAGVQSAVTADAWTTATVVAKGEIQKLSGGKYIVAQNGGTTGATEPAITGKANYDELEIDGNVIWVLRDNLYTSIHNAGFCTDKYFIVQRVSEGCGATGVMDTIGLNVELGSLNIEKTDATIGMNQTVSLMATKGYFSTDDDFIDITTSTPVVLNGNYWTADDVLIRIDGEKYGTLYNFSANYTRNINMGTSTEPKERITKVDAPTLSGNVTLELDPVEFNKVYETDRKSVVVTFDKGNGEKVIFTYPITVFDNPKQVGNANEVRTFTADLKPIGNSTTPMATVTVQTGLTYKTV